MRRVFHLAVCWKAAPGRPGAGSRTSSGRAALRRFMLSATARYFDFRSLRFAILEPVMRGVTIVEHPLVQHKLTLLRDKNRSTKAFRELFAEIGNLLCYEVTRDLPLEMIEIETP